MTMEEYKIELEKWKVDVAEWQKAQKAYLESIINISKKRLPSPGPSPRPPVPPAVDSSKLKDLLGKNNPSIKPVKPVNPTPSGMPRPI